MNKDITCFIVSEDKTISENILSECDRVKQIYTTEINSTEGIRNIVKHSDTDFILIYKT